MEFGGATAQFCTVLPSRSDPLGHEIFADVVARLPRFRHDTLSIEFRHKS